MAKSLRLFRENFEKVIPNSAENLPEVVESDKAEFLPSHSASLGSESVKLLDQLERAGFTAIAGKLRELQVSEGLAALDPLCRRLRAIEQQIDDMLALGSPLDMEELQRMVSVLADAYQTRAKALLLPHGTVSPRTALQGSKGGSAAVNVAIGIGTGVSPRAK